MKKLIILAGLLLSSATAQAQTLVPSVDGLFVCDGVHPRCAVADQSTYPYYQFGLQHVGQYAGISDVLEAGPPLIHYQTFLAELISRRADTNAVALWGDAQSVVNGGRVWGGFLSARSDFTGLPAGSDSQLVGLEIDVLNDGLPGIYPNASKVGLQIVGFGKTNTNAIEVLTETPSAAFMNGLNFASGSIAANGTVIGVGPQNAAIGINMQYSQFSDAALLVSENQRLVFRTAGTADAAIWRDSIGQGHLVLQAGPEGLRVVDATNTTNLLTVTPTGDVVTATGSLPGLSSRITTLEHTAPTSSFAVSADNTSARPAPSATGKDALAAASGATAAGSGSVAVGAAATATGTNSVAIGAGSADGGQANVVSVGSATQTRRITNVAPGISPTDAVNVAQLNALATDVRELRRETHGASASAMAVAALPQTFERGRGMVGLGVGTWQGEKAFAVGVSKATDDGRFAFKVGATYNSQGNGGANAGVGFAF